MYIHIYMCIYTHIHTYIYEWITQETGRVEANFRVLKK